MAGQTDGFVPMEDYSGVTTAGEGIDLILALLGDPDATVTDARAAGSNLDEISPVARAQLVVELEALKAEVDLFDAPA